jgi:predicted DNA-binding transcriptional regulator AlpA
MVILRKALAWICIVLIYIVETRGMLRKMNKTIELRGQAYDSGILLRDRYGLSAMTIYRWTRRGLLPPPIRLGRVNFYARNEVEARLSRGTEQNNLTSTTSA